MGFKTIKGKFAIIIILITIMVFTNVFLSFKGDKDIQDVKNSTFPTYKLSNTMSQSLIEVWQYLSDISATRGLDGLDDGIKEADVHATEFIKAAKQLETLEPSKQKEIDEILVAFDDYYKTGTEMANIYMKEGTEAGNKFMPKFDDASSKILKLTNKLSEEQDNGIVNSLDKTAFQNNISLYMLITSGIALMIFVFILSKQIINPLEKLVSYADDIAKGDLSKNSGISGRKDEIGRLAYAFEISVQSMKDIISKIEYTSNKVNNFSNEIKDASYMTSSTSEQVASSIEEISVGASTQLSEINKVSSFIGSLDSDIEKAVTKLEETSNMTKQSKEMSELGVRSMDNIENNMSAIYEFNKKNVEKIGELEINSIKINQIVDAITQISDQTNLLALNAAIEAARAGESGRGFSVVSDEIRKLAEQSNSSAKLITEVVKEIQNQISEITLYIGNGTKYIEDGVTIVSEAASRFSGIVSNTEGILKYVNQVTSFSRDINDVSKKIKQYIRSILAIVENSSTFTEEVMAASEENTANIQNISTSISELTELTGDLKKLVRNFKVT
ncbi:methyl-accepting chemotaxis protein [Clostridium sp. YIM B02505]|uniref:Methyl-accepting chemotaxis protein n=1 Tax=Clostridium yunnanense TaxID=2800325 RepID=A0ABS1EPE3_9CLOT|nr:methyl-accepting chemotaxis protein [Clostridium yunnanense]MBK1811246.1 methyl-accepting chemotaxis protein [Clostridium yunnanense]